MIRYAMERNNKDHGHCNNCGQELDFANDGVSKYRCTHCLIPHCPDCKHHGMCPRCYSRRIEKVAADLSFDFSLHGCPFTLNRFIGFLQEVAKFNGEKVVNAKIELYNEEFTKTGIISLTGTNRRG